MAMDPTPACNATTTRNVTVLFSFHEFKGEPVCADPTPIYHDASCSVHEFR